MVLGAGEVLEFDSPSKLLADKSSVFYSMAQDAGLVEWGDIDGDTVNEWMCT